jgi:hypothetical protein
MTPYNELTKNYEYALDAIRAALRYGKWDKWGEAGQKVEDILAAALASAAPTSAQEFGMDLYSGIK